MATEKKERHELQCNASYRGSYMDLLEARAFKKNGVAQGEPRFGGTFLMPKDAVDLKKLQAEVVAVLKAKLGADKKLIVNRLLTQEELDSGKAVVVQVPWKDGDKEADRMKAAGKDGEANRGHVLVVSKSKYQPNLAAFVEKGKPPVDFLTEEAVAANAKYFYSGAFYVPCFGIHFYPGDAKNPAGVSLFLNAVLFHKHGEKLGSARKSSAETFKGFMGTISDEDTTAGATDTLGGDDEF